MTKKQQEKLDKFLTKFDELTEAATSQQECAERALYLLLVAHKQKLFPVDGYFHKSFRQCDVTGSGHLDMAIWLLAGTSEKMWEAYKHCNKRKHK